MKFLLSLTLLYSSLALADNPTCRALVDKDLQELGMGKSMSPTSCVEKEDDDGREFYELGSGQVKLNYNTHKVKGYDAGYHIKIKGFDTKNTGSEKSVWFNDDCSVKRVSVSMPGININVKKDTCDNFIKTKKLNIKFPEPGSQIDPFDGPQYVAHLCKKYFPPRSGSIKSTTHIKNKSKTTKQ